jgi:hypothetical protein
MGIAKLHKCYGVKIDPDVLSGSSVMLGGIHGSFRVSPNIEVSQETTSGAIYAVSQTIVSGAPMVGFNSYSLGRALDVVGLTGLAIAAATQTGLTYYGNAAQEGGGRRSGSNHLSWNTKEGMLLPRRITCRHQGHAALSLENLITYDGTNQPIVPASGVAVPTAALDEQRYSIGPVQIGTVTGDKLTISQIINVEIDFGIMATAESSDSDLYPTFVTINEIVRPVIRITTTDVSLFAASGGIPLHGKAIDLSHTILFLRKRTLTPNLTASGYVADGTAEHISFVPAAGCAYHDSIIDVSNPGNGTAVIEIPLISDGTNPPLAIDTTAAIALPS